ncbi:hypothetical protein MDA_GLEAN10000854 [Myotis davidii]|uniref:Uncharacterized protein n=1 Tax=Myotis davidii TaxID=225400 RepID=L5LAY5_MYODS|nr:hypothetical protein MDA_GLEAN10000854 [Myotis davidii]
MEFPEAPARKGLVPWLGLLLAGKEGTIPGNGRRLGVRDWPRSPGEDSALGWEEGLPFGPE